MRTLVRRNRRLGSLLQTRSIARKRVAQKSDLTWYDRLAGFLERKKRAMKIIRFLILVCLVTIISVFSELVLSYSAKGVLSTLYKTPEITLAKFKDLPKKPVSSNAVGFADIAWKTFVTLNWPAGSDGSPLEKAFGEEPIAPRVWEFYHTPDEVFLANGKEPSADIPNPVARTLNLDLIKGQGSGILENFDWEKNLSKSREWVEEVINRGSCPSKTNAPLLEKKLLLNNIPLVDRRGNYIIIEMRLHHNEFKQIFDNKWFDASNLAAYNDSARFQFKSTNTTDAPLEIKAAWRVFDDNSSPQEKARYYTAKRRLAIPASQYACTSGNCPAGESVIEEVEVGLIGFHISYKIPQQQGSTPGWVWATFEQVDNLEVLNPPPGVDLKPTLFNPDCRENCQPNYPYVEWPFLWRDRSPHAVTRSQDGQIKEQIPTQVVRLSQQDKCDNSGLDPKTKADLKQQNENWQQAFRKVPNSVWQYYQLVGTQWMQSPGIVDRNAPLQNPPISQRHWLISEIRKNQIRPGSGSLVNVSMEAYSQTQTNGDSCIGCHVNATLPKSRGNSQKVMSDFSFMLERAQSSAIVNPMPN